MSRKATERRKRCCGGCPQIYIFTNFYLQCKKDVWSNVCRLIGVYPGADPTIDFGRAGHGHTAAAARMSNDEVVVVGKAMPIKEVGGNVHPHIDGVNPF